MKKLSKLFFVCIAAAAVLSSCNYNPIDLTWRFNKAVIKIGDTAKTVEISNWRDYEESDTVQIAAKDGTIYLTHYANVVLIKE